jgi:hypothetical protein
MTIDEARDRVVEAARRIYTTGSIHSIESGDYIALRDAIRALDALASSPADTPAPAALTEERVREMIDRELDDYGLRRGLSPATIEQRLNGHFQRIIAIEAKLAALEAALTEERIRERIHEAELAVHARLDIAHDGFDKRLAALEAKVVNLRGGWTDAEIKAASFVKLTPGQVRFFDEQGEIKPASATPWSAEAALEHLFYAYGGTRDATHSSHPTAALLSELRAAREAGIREAIERLKEDAGNHGEEIPHTLAAIRALLPKDANTERKP